MSSCLPRSSVNTAHQEVKLTTRGAVWGPMCMLGDCTHIAENPWLIIPIILIFAAPLWVQSRILRMDVDEVII